MTITMTSTLTIEEQLSLRKESKWGKFFHHVQEKDFPLQKNLFIPAFFLLSPSDVGVCRNGGRRGAQYAPKAILQVLKNQAYHSPLPPSSEANLSVMVPCFEVAKLADEECDYGKAQQASKEKIKSLLDSPWVKDTFEQKKPIFHLGGGHDHIYPLLQALEEQGAKKITVINIDAHCDTRVDQLPHSGTPFRQFAGVTQTDFHLIQLGIHSFANDQATMSPLARGKMQIFSLSDILHQTQHNPLLMKSFLQQQLTFEKDQDQDQDQDQDYNHLYILSLDCDALQSSVMEGVSAVNHDGFPLSYVQEIFAWYEELMKKLGRKEIYGIYEYNPVYDNLSQKGARALTSLIYSRLARKY